MSSTVFFAFALAMVMGLLSSGCDYFTEKKDDFDSRIACGNEHQAAANDQIDDCVSQGCTEFWVCMVFDAAPVCYGFVSE